MIKNLKDLVIIILTFGVLVLLGVIIIGDYYVALQENRPVDESVITLMKMALTGLIGIIAMNLVTLRTISIKSLLM